MTKRTSTPSTIQPLQPGRNSPRSQPNDFDRSDEGTAPTDDPGDAQRSSKTGADGDGEEELR